MLRDLAVLVAVFTGATAIAEALGAPNLGTAASFGQLAFMLALVAILLRR